MRKSLCLAALIGGILAAAPAVATTYVGTRNFAGATVNLSLTTDGSLGWIGENRITAFHIEAAYDGHSFVVDSPNDPNGSGIQTFSLGAHDVLYATPDTISFDFSEQAQS